MDSHRQAQLWGYTESSLERMSLRKAGQASLSSKVRHPNPRVACPV